MVGNSPRDCGPGGQWLCFIFIWWGIVLMGSCPRTIYINDKLASLIKNCMTRCNVRFQTSNSLALITLKGSMRVSNE